MIELKGDGLRATFTPLGARLVSLFFDGADMVAGGGTEEQILAGDWTVGATCGRYAGRITNACFTLDGETYKLAPNIGKHQLHGGPDNFAVRRWDASASGQAVTFSLQSPDGDQGFPGTMDVSATYRVDGLTLSLVLEARTTKPTVINLTNHAYWNLTGEGRNAFDLEMQIDGHSFLVLDELLLPSGEIKKVDGTRWDFRSLRKVNEPYDHCWVLDGKRGEMKRGLVLRDPGSGRRMEVWTTECAIQMYTAIHWNADMPGRNGPLVQHGAIAIEPQNLPDAPTHANFPSSVLRPGETYRHHMEWRFSKG